MKNLLFLISIALLSGCASNLPKAISEAPENSPEVAQAREDTQSLIGKEVRWGGQIALVKNLKDSSEIEIVARNLFKSGRPKDSDNSAGRFIAIVREFIDPNVYKVDREVTVRGKISGSKNGKVGEYDYSYPVVEADNIHLWPEIKKTDPNDFYHPWFYPGYYRYGHSGFYGSHFLLGHPGFYYPY